MLLAFVISSLAFAEEKHSYKEHLKNIKIKNIFGYDMAYFDQGHGTPYVFIHGIPTNSWMYRKLLKRISRNHRVLAPDLLGFGRSEKTKDKVFVPDHAKLLHRLIVKELNLHSFHLVVHDFGGAVAWEMLQQKDFEIKSLTILNTFMFKKGWNNGYNAMTKFANNVMPSMIPKTFFKMGIKDMFFEKPSKPVVNGYIKPFKGKHSTAGYRRLYGSIGELERDRLSVFQAVTKERLKGVPIKIIWGRHDKFLSVDEQMPLIVKHFKVKKKNVLTLEKGKHLVADENAAEIIKFMGF